MRTPGNDFELAAGFCFTEGLLAGAPVTGVRYCADGPAIDSEFNVVTVETGGRRPSADATARHDVVELRAVRPRPARRPDRRGSTPFDGDAGIALDVLAAVPSTVLGGQGLFGETGAVHAAAAFDAAGTSCSTREDVGRHNAVDKVVGALLLDGRLPAHDGRRRRPVRQRPGVDRDGPEGVGRRLPRARRRQRPDVARRRRRPPANLTLVGFVRADGFNVYGLTAIVESRDREVRRSGRCRAAPGCRARPPSRRATSSCSGCRAAACPSPPRSPPPSASRST